MSSEGGRLAGYGLFECAGLLEELDVVEEMAS